ncbi:DUF5994 family protein [Streptosporangium sp. CA-135522]|uniref:DUF5994 family protein n=1 Tax=Streptosporangium sp. CA-135522 TaxID=3240072 RepID=UPI003D93A4FD
MTPKLLSRITPLTIIADAVPATTSSAVRLSLDPALGRRNVVDGAWWPYSRNAAVELPGLIAAVDQRLGRAILRIALHLDAWDDIPRRVPARGRQVMVDWFRGADFGLIRLTLAGMEHVDLLVVPSGTARAPAVEALLTGAGRVRPIDILTAMRRRSAMGELIACPKEIS